MTQFRADIIIIGGGNMGSAMAHGLLINPDLKIVILTNTPSKCSLYICENPNIYVTDDIKNISLSQNACCILAVKPYAIQSVIGQYADILKQCDMVVSVAAGISYHALQGWAWALDIQSKIIRAMPNLPVAFGTGLIGYYAPEPSSVFQNLFSRCGQIIYLKHEYDMHAFTALAGSGPAFLFHFMESLAIAGEKIGLSTDLSAMIARNMVIGASDYARHHGNIGADILRQNVTSPAGTTFAGLTELIGQDINPHQSHLTDLLMKTLSAAQKRSLELAE